MKSLTHLLLVALAVPLAARAGSSARVALPSTVPICEQTSGLLRDAHDALRRGDADQAKALAELVLLPPGVRIRPEDPDRSGGALDAAISKWNSSIGEPVFHRSGGDGADVVVRVVPRVDGDDNLQGVVDSEVSEGGHVRATIQVRGDSEGRPLTSRELAEVIEHELGHVLGLDDHPGSEGLMGEFDPRHVIDRPTEDERQAVRGLRIEARSILREAERLDRSTRHH